MSKPVIGITGPEKGGTAAWLATALSIILAGGHPVRITNTQPATIEDIDGLIIGGGSDIDPDRYGQILTPREPGMEKRRLWRWILSVIFFPFYWFIRKIFSAKTAAIDKKRDELELGLISDAVQYNKPILGICRGMQLLNVHFGGSLHQDISGFYSEESVPSSLLPLKKIRLEEDSILLHIFGRNEQIVNALHHQAIDKLGTGLRVVAREVETNISQGIQHSTKKFVVGVQWHPEYLIQIADQRKLFRNLVKHASDHPIGIV